MTSGMRQPDELRALDVTIFQALILARAATDEGLYAYKLCKDEAGYMHKTGVYRVIGRLAERGLIVSEQEKSPQGPDRQEYHTTEAGKQLLAATVLEMLRVIDVATPIQMQPTVDDNPLSPNKIKDE